MGRFLLALCLAVVAAAAGTSARATAIAVSTTSLNGFTDSFSADSGAITGTLTFWNFSFINSPSATEVDYYVTIDNTSTLSDGSSRLVSFGYNVAPFPTSVGVGFQSGSATGGFSIFKNANITAGNSYSVCASSGNNCSGGGNGGVTEGGSLTLKIALTGFATNTTSVAFGSTTDPNSGNTGFDMKFQTATLSSFEPYGGTPVGCGVMNCGKKVPEPSSLALFSTALLGLFGLARRYCV